MKISRFRLAALLAFLTIISGAISAQNGTMTPYSRFGYGILSDNATAAQSAMGGVGYAMNSGRQINVMNPASYARVDSLTFLFDMGLDFTSLWTSETIDGVRNSESNIGGGLGYITMQFPISKRLGMSAGLLPFSSVGYAFGNDINHGFASRQGSGSINQLYLGLGAKIVSGLNIGVNVAYLFGTTINDTYAITTSGSTGLYERELKVRDFRITAGLQYTLPFRGNSLTLGLSYTPGKQLLGSTRTLFYDTNADVTSNGAADPEITDDFKLKDLYSLADTYGAGLGLNLDSRIWLEGDVTYQPWSKCKYNGNKGELADRYKISLGGQYQPALRGSYFRRTQYRLGAFYDRDYLVVRGNNVREYGASVGVGLPVPGFKTVVSLSLGWLHRQAYPTALIKEDYLNITVGVNFNEMWFRKNRIY